MKCFFKWCGGYSLDYYLLRGRVLQGHIQTLSTKRTEGTLMEYTKILTTGRDVSSLHKIKDSWISKFLMQVTSVFKRPPKA